MSFTVSLISHPTWREQTSFIFCMSDLREKGSEYEVAERMKNLGGQDNMQSLLVLLQ